MLSKILIAIAIVLALTANALVAPIPAQAEESQPAAASAGFAADVDTRRVDRAHERILDEGIELTATLDGGRDSDVTLQLDDDGSGSFSIQDGGPARPFTIDVETSTPERIIFTVTDPSTGNSFDYDSSRPTPRLAFLIPVAFAAFPIATLLYYLAIGAALVIGGYIALEAGKAIGKIIATNNSRPASKRRNYYPAARSGSKLMISPKGYLKSEAVAQGRAGRDVWALSATHAKSLATDLNRSGKPIGWERHSGGVRHYHPYKHSPNMHSFFGGH